MITRLALLVAFAGSTLALAQQGPPLPEPPRDEGGVPRTPFNLHAAFNAYAEHAFSSDLDDDAGSVSVTRGGGALDVVIPLNERHKLVATFGAEFSHYEFDDDTLLAGADEPWDDILQNFVGITYRGQINDHWGVLAGASVDASYQTGADFGDSLSFGVRGGATYSINENVTVGAGLAVYTRLEDDAIFIPFPIVDWKISDQWSVRTGSRALRGIRAEVVYSPIQKLSLSLGAGLEGREFRLDDDGPIPGGVGRDWSVPVSFIARWQIASQIALRGEVGAQFFKNYTIDDQDGDELADVDGDPAPFVGLGIDMNF